MTYTGTPANLRNVTYEVEMSPLKKSLNSQNTFSSAQKWEQMSMSSAQGIASLDSAYIGCTFDGRYIYFTPLNSDTFVRYDSTQSFATSASWQQIAMSSAQGGAALDVAYLGCTFDGKYVYFTAVNSDTFIRFLANNTNTPGPIEYAQVSS